ncbi:MAG: YgfZ/GcvT domain-containing protein [Magnetovibrionaceae bacterium]
MDQATLVALEDRGLIAIGGADRVTFLQGLVTSDITKLTATNAQWAAFLTAQGKYLFDFFVFEAGEAIWLEVEKARIPDFMKRLKMYKLRSDVTLTDISDDHRVFAAFGPGALDALGLPGEAGALIAEEGSIRFVDPRLAKAGARLILASGSDAPSGLVAGDRAAFDAHRIALGLPDGSRDLVIDKSTLLEYGFDELGGVDWKKGCFMGQELTARMKYRGLVKKRLVPAKAEGTLPEAGTHVMAGEKPVGEVFSGEGDQALILVKLEALEGDAPLVADGVTLTPQKPDWVNF